MKIAFLSGTSIVRSALFDTWDVRSHETAYGRVDYKAKGDFLLLNRHGFGAPLPPHRINYRANIRALADLGFSSVLSLNSVGSLKPELAPGTLVSCSDYVCLQSPPQTFFDDELKGGAPGIDNDLLPLVRERVDLPIESGKIYVQMRGPRFETKAEIALIRHWGDVVGMTMAGEADLCREIGLKYTSLAMIDNYANGLMNEEIDFAKFRELVRANQETVNRLFVQLLKHFA